MHFFSRVENGGQTNAAHRKRQVAVHVVDVHQQTVGRSNNEGDTFARHHQNSAVIAVELKDNKVSDAAAIIAVIGVICAG